MAEFVNHQDVILGGLPLMLDGQDYVSPDGYVLRVIGEGADLGNPAGVTQVLLSMLTDGSLVEHDRDDNREPVFIVEVEATYDGAVGVLAQDTFNAADSTDINGRVVTTGTVAWAAAAGTTWGITSNKASKVNTNGGYLTLDIGQTDVTIEADVTLATTPNGAGLAFRVVDGSNYLRLIFDSGNNRFIVQKLVGGSTTNVAFAAGGSASAGSTYTLKVVMAGASVTVFQNAVQVMTYTITDSVLLTGTKHGLYSNGGAASSTERWENFTITGVLPDTRGLALAKGEAALRAVCKKPAELVWKPPQVGALPAVFDVVHSTLDLEYTDEDEIGMLRAYRIGMTCLPYARSEDPTTFSAEPVPPAAGPTLTVINNSDTTAGWSASPDVVTDVGTAIRVTGDSGSSLLITEGTLTVTAGAFTGLPYVVIEERVGGPSTISMKTGTGFGSLPLVKVAAISQGGGWNQVWFRIDPPASGWTLATLTQLVVRQDVSPYPVPAASWFEVRDVSAAASGPVFGTNKQLIRNLAIGGTERTQGSIDVVHATTDLGDCIVYTRPQPPEDPYIPAISRYATGGSSTPANVSGLAFTGSSLSFTIPSIGLPPGEYHVVARVNTQATIAPKQFTIATEARLGGAAVVTGQNVVNQVSTPASTYVIRSLGTVTLPPTPLGTDGEVFMTISYTADGFANPILIDEVWLFHESGELTIVEGVDRPRLSVVAPNLNDPHGAIWASDDPVLGTAYSVASKCLARDHHNLEPGDNMLVTVTTGVGGAPATATAYKRFSHFPDE